MNVKIRQAQSADFSTMYTISSRAHTADYYDAMIPKSGRAKFDERYQLSVSGESAFIRRLSRWLADPSTYALVAVDGGKVVGYTIAKHTIDSLELRSLFVDPEFQSRGIGAQLFEMSLQLRRSNEPIRLVVLTANDRAKQLYKRYGFTVTKKADERFYGAEQEVMEQINH